MSWHLKCTLVKCEVRHFISEASFVLQTTKNNNWISIKICFTVMVVRSSETGESVSRFDREAQNVRTENDFNGVVI